MEIKYLNRLCTFFSGAYGYTNKGECLLNKSSSIVIKNALKNNLVNVDDENQHKIKNVESGMYVCYSFSEGYLKKRSRRKMNYKKVILRVDEEMWDGIPEVWYTSSNYDENLKVPPVDSRKWINIVSDFIRVEIDASQKGSKITLDDILFASRCFMIDGYRTVSKYKILSLDDDVLEIEPIIDNED